MAVASLPSSPQATETKPESNRHRHPASPRARGERGSGEPHLTGESATRSAKMDAGGPLLPLDHDQEGWDAADAGMAEAFVPDADNLHGGDDAATPPSPAPLPPHPLRRRRPGPPLRRPFWSLVGAGSVALGTAAAAAVVCRTFPVMDEVPARSSHQIRPTPVDNLFFPGTSNRAVRQSPCIELRFFLTLSNRFFCSESVPDLMNDDSVWASIPRDGTSIAEMHDTTSPLTSFPPLPRLCPVIFLTRRSSKVSPVFLLVPF